MADFAASVTLPYAEAIGLPLEPYAAIQRWRDRLALLPAWSAPFPSPGEARPFKPG